MTLAVFFGLPPCFSFTVPTEARELAAALSLDRRYSYPHVGGIERPDLAQLSELDVEALDEVVRE
jgi:hypothetical protein